MGWEDMHAFFKLLFWMDPKGPLDESMKMYLVTLCVLLKCLQ